MKQWIAALFCCLLLFAGTPLRGASLSDHLPYDTLAFVEIDPDPMTVKTDRKGRGEFFDLGVQAMSSLGVMPHEAAAVTNLLRLAGMVGQRHNVAAWIDADFLVDYETSGLSARSGQFIWIVDVDGQPDSFLTLLSSVLSDYSTPQTAKQSVQKTDTTSYVEFYDTRWPAWLRLYWMQEGSNLVLSVGTGSMEHYISKTGKHLPWDATISKVDDELTHHGPASSLVLRAWCSTKQMHDRWPDVMTMTIASRLLKAFDLRYTDQALLTGTLRDREFLVNYATLENDVLSVVPWTAELPADAPLRKLVPVDASYYLIFNIDWEAFYSRIVNVMDVAAEHHKDEGIKNAVEKFEQLYGVNVREDIQDGLSPLVLIHDAPRHPLRLPGMVTVIAAANPEKQQQVRFAVDKLIAQAARVLDRRAGQGADAWTPDAGNKEPAAEATPGRWAHLQIRRDKDGVSYLQYGLAGPAWVWTDRRFVFSWSPTATREIADLVRQFPMTTDWFYAPPPKSRE